MPRDGSQIYHVPPGSDGSPNTVISSAKYNTLIHDLEADNNNPRPVVAGGTGASTPGGAAVNIGAATSAQIVTPNFASFTFANGFWSSDNTISDAPIPGHRYRGYANFGPDGDGFLIAWDNDALSATGGMWAMEKKSGVYSAWSQKLPVTISDATPTLAAHGQLWWQSNSGLLYIYYDDGNSKQWVLATPIPDPTVFVNKAGDTMTGPLTLPGNPTSALQAAPKQYIDTVSANVVHVDFAQGLTTANQIQGRQNIGLQPAIRSIGAADTIVASDFGKLIELYNAGGTNFQLNLTACATLGSGFWFDLINAMGQPGPNGLVTLKPATESIDFTASAVVGAVERMRVWTDGTQWFTGLCSGEWIPYTPTITPTGGAFGSASATMRYKKIRTTLHYAINANVVTVGTATGFINVSLPFVCAGNGYQVGAGAELAVNGYSIYGSATNGSGTLTIRYYNNTAPAIVAGSQYWLNGSYEVGK